MSTSDRILTEIIARSPELDRSLQSVSTLVTHGAHHTPAYVSDGVPLVMATNVFADHIDLSNTRFISRQDHQAIYRRAPIERGDVLFINIGATTGTVTKVETDLQFSIKNVALVKPNRRILDADYLVYLLRSRTVKDRIATKQAQTCQSFLALRDLRDLRLPVPPIGEQVRIVAYLDGLRTKAGSLKKLQEERSKELDALMPSILCKAFAGEL